MSTIIKASVPFKCKFYKAFKVDLIKNLILYVYSSIIFSKLYTSQVFNKK